MESGGLFCRIPHTVRFDLSCYGKCAARLFTAAAQCRSAASRDIVFSHGRQIAGAVVFIEFFLRGIGRFCCLSRLGGTATAAMAECSCSRFRYGMDFWRLEYTGRLWLFRCRIAIRYAYALGQRACFLTLPPEENFVVAPRMIICRRL